MNSSILKDQIAKTFEDRESALATWKQVEALLACDLSAQWLPLFEQTSSPGKALINLQRWLSGTANPLIYSDVATRHPQSFRRLLLVLGASQPLAESLLQNPELGSYLIEEPAENATTKELIDEGARLVAAADSPTYALDRIRYLKRKHLLALTADDLGDTVAQENVWRGLSDLADAVITLCVNATWKQFGEGECPIGVIAFGKLGGHELNYSSDVDLCYVTEPGVVDALGKVGPRFCEALGRALGEHMGRGNLYRVDLRLRPFGNAGAILNTIDAVENYYKLYAEAWEIQALLRSRPIVSSQVVANRWKAMVEQYCFKPSLSEMAVSEMVTMRARLEDKGGADDLKRGPGGIRDIEFLTQMLQLANGFRLPDLRIPNTCEALAGIAKHQLLEQATIEKLLAAYRFLRKLEHRLQIFADVQTHTLPADEAERKQLARSMGFASYLALKHELDTHRTTASNAYKSVVQHSEQPADARSQVLEGAGIHAATLANWIDSFEGAEGIYTSLAENDASLQRAVALAESAPVLLPELRKLTLTEQVISGEILEPVDEVAKLKATDGMWSDYIGRAREAKARLLCRWHLAGDFSLTEALTDWADAVILRLCQEVGACFSVLALGSYGRCEVTPLSDLDVVLLCEQEEQHPASEEQAQKLLGLVARARQQGLDFSIDLRLRPDGGKGLLVRSLAALQNYDLEGMEMWERFALGMARRVYKAEKSFALVNKLAYAQPLTLEMLHELLQMKRRIENERLDQRHKLRNLKLGTGGLNDIEWLVHLLELRYGGTSGDPSPPDPLSPYMGEGRSSKAYPQGRGSSTLTERISGLVTNQRLNAYEGDMLKNALQFLQVTRCRAQLMGIENDNIPENPDKLDYLARSGGLQDGNQFLSRYQEMTSEVRGLYEDTLERLRQ